MADYDTLLRQKEDILLREKEREQEKLIEEGWIAPKSAKIIRDKMLSCVFSRGCQHCTVCFIKDAAKELGITDDFWYCKNNSMM